MIISILTILILLITHLLPRKVRHKVLGNIRRCLVFLRRKIRSIYLISSRYKKINDERGLAEVNADVNSGKNAFEIRSDKKKRSIPAIYPKKIRHKNKRLFPFAVLAL